MPIDPHLNQRINNLEHELKNKIEIIKDGDKRHDEMLYKLQSMENRIEQMDQKSKVQQMIP